MTVLRDLNTVRVLIRDDTKDWAPAVRDGCLIALKRIEAALQPVAEALGSDDPKQHPPEGAQPEPANERRAFEAWYLSKHRELGSPHCSASWIGWLARSVSKAHQETASARCVCSNGPLDTRLTCLRCGGDVPADEPIGEIVGTHKVGHGSMPLVMWFQTPPPIKTKLYAGALPAVPQEPATWQAFLREFVNLCAVGDITEDSDDGLGWADLVKRANAMLGPVPAAPDAHKQVAVLKFNDGHAELVDHWTGRFMASSPKAEDAVWLAKRVNAAALPAPSVPASDLDAMRYRFLRNQKDWGGWYWDGSNNMFHGEDLDTAIDDAMDAPSSLGSASGDGS